jgi:heptosyltransferase-2
LLQKLAGAHPDARFLIFSGPADEEVSQYIAQRANHQHVVIVRQSNLRHALAVLKRCRLVVSNDSAVMHLAAASNVPVVGLFGPTNAQRLHPWAPRQVVVKQNLACMPCFFYSSRPLRCGANLNYACMREISVESVFAAVEGLLDRDLHSESGGTYSVVS